MPEDKKPAEASPATPPVDQGKLAAEIVEGLSKGLQPLVERMSSNQRSVPATPVHSEAVVARPTEEQLAEALIDGNKAEYARLLKLQRAADEQERQRELGVIRSQGGAALGSAAKQLAATNLKYYKRFQKEIDDEIAIWQANNPSAIPTFDHYKYAEDFVKGRHVDDLLAEDREEQIRKSREPADTLEHNARTSAAQNEAEPTSLEEAFPGWTSEFRPKARAVGGRSDDEELRKMGFRGGLKEVLQKRKELDQIQNEVGDSFGLDKDWIPDKDDPTKGRWVN